MSIRSQLFKIAIGASTFIPFSVRADCNSQQGNALQDISGSACSATALSGKTNDVINALFIVVGGITVIIMIIGGIRYITSTGNSTRIQQAKDTILYAIIGLIVVILARAIVGFVIGKIA